MNAVSLYAPYPALPFYPNPGWVALREFEYGIFFHESVVARCNYVTSQATVLILPPGIYILQANPQATVRCNSLDDLNWTGIVGSGSGSEFIGPGSTCPLKPVDVLFSTSRLINTASLGGPTFYLAFKVPNDQPNAVVQTLNVSSPDTQLYGAALWMDTLEATYNMDWNLLRMGTALGASHPFFVSKGWNNVVSWYDPSTSCKESELPPNSFPWSHTVDGPQRKHERLKTDGHPMSSSTVEAVRRLIREETRLPIGEGKKI